MPTTPNKGYEVQVTGSNSGTWGSTLNDDMITIVDNNLGSTTSKTLSNSNVALSTTESQSLILRLTGNLSANVQITTSAVGMTIIENLCTVGAFAVTFTDGVGAVTLPPLARSVVITGAAAGARIVANNFPSGTRMLFQQTTPPVGWTKESSSTYDDAALRIVTGTPGTGGSVAFSTAFASQSVTGTVGDTTLTGNQIPAHQHLVVNGDTVSDFGGLNGSSFLALIGGSGTGSNTNRYNLAGSGSTPDRGLTSSIGGSASHTHSFTGTAINLAVKRVDCIIAQKD